MNHISVVLIWGVVTFPKGIFTPSDFQMTPENFARVQSNHFILNWFISCGDFHVDVVKNLNIARTWNTEFGIVMNIENKLKQWRLLLNAICVKSKLTSYAVVIFGDKYPISQKIHPISYLMLSTREWIQGLSQTEPLSEGNTSCVD